MWPDSKSILARSRAMVTNLKVTGNKKITSKNDLASILEGTMADQEEPAF